VVGVEALARGPAGTDLEFPDRLFAAAREVGRLGELDLLCAERALEIAIAAPVPPPLLFVNGEPSVMDQPLSPRLLEMLLAGLPFRHVLEFTERALPAVPGSLLRIAGAVQQLGNCLALDDVGVDPMSLAFLPVLEPEVVKPDMSLLRDPGAAATREVSAVVRSEAARTGAVVVAEGIETEADLRTARDLGAHWGQGWLFGRPGAVEAVHDRFDPAAAGALRPSRPGFHQPAGSAFETATGFRPATPGTAEDLAAELTRLRDLIIADGNAVFVASFSATEFPQLAETAAGLIGRTRSVILLDDPIPGELAAVVIGAGYGAALCVRAGQSLETVPLDRLPAVAAIARILMNRRG
jgi:EAL domain-containing protein (putative c-di-GMP-specific phosphodiesterase class I)